MGNCFSDPSKPPGKGQVLGSTPQTSSQNQQTQQPNLARPVGPGSGKNNAPPRTLSDNPALAADGDPRERALRAAEERAKAAQGKGVNLSNPKAGQLSSKLASERKAPLSPTNNQDERLMDRGDWN